MSGTVDEARDKMSDAKDTVEDKAHGHEGFFDKVKDKVDDAVDKVKDVLDRDDDKMKPA